MIARALLLAAIASLAACKGEDTEVAVPDDAGGGAPALDGAPDGPAEAATDANGGETSDGHLLDQGAADGEAGGDAAACATVASAFDAACAACLTASCCDDGAACEGNAECAALLACIRACGPDAGSSDPCVQACGGQHANGIADYNVLVLCLGNDCHGACPY